MKSDNLRFIENLNTQVRSLPTLSQLVTEIGLNKTTISIVENKLIEWSDNLEMSSSLYKDQKGTLANSKNERLIVNRYLKLALSLGICNNINEVTYNTDLGKILLRLNQDKLQDVYYLQETELIFLSNLLIINDFDVIVLALKILNQFEKISQNKILGLFNSEFLNRLKTKQKHSTHSAKNVINEKFRKIKFEWEKPEIYAEHIIVPRLEWLNQINLIQKNSFSTQTTYQINKNGINFLKTLNYLPEQQFYEIDDEWINKNLQKVIVENCLQNQECKTWKELNRKEKILLLGDSIIEAYNLFSKGSAFRVPILPTLLLAISNIYQKRKIVAELGELKGFLKDSFKFDQRSISIREAARLNEGYILVKF